jgi:hypothetical protein
MRVLLVVTPNPGLGRGTRRAPVIRTIAGSPGFLVLLFITILVERLGDMPT